MERRDYFEAIMKPGKNPWPVRALIAGVGTLPLLALMAVTPMSWWKQSGFTSYPGTYVRMRSGNYWLCRPWNGRMPESRKDAQTKMTARFGTVTGTKESNFAVLLPRTARVTAIYCGAAPASHTLGECAGTHCALPAHFQVEDGLYTLGRGVIFSVRMRAAKPDSRSDVGFWVAWR
jgi:hypothetical protein